ncbi:MAG: amylo-alpha-1,6-glucosidase [Syntrophales bacterium]
MIRITPGTAAELDREWLETDGRGGYAAGTLAGWHTRRYHGLMVANLPTPEGRYCLLSKLEDSLACGQEEYFFTHHRYPGSLFPPGPPLLREFTLARCPAFTYRTGTLLLHKQVILVQGTGDLLVRYDLERAPAGGLLRLKPLLAYRGYHELARENPYLRSRTEGIADGFTIEPYGGMPPLSLRTSLASRFLPSPLWYRRFEYTEERERGFDWHEDLFMPGVIEVPCEQGETVILLATADPTGEDPAALWDAELARRGRETSRDGEMTGCGISPRGGPRKGQSRAGVDGNELGGCPGDEGELLRALVRAGRQFLIRTPSGRPAVIAGYPWFGSWGRDTLISLPGLAFCTDRIGEGIEILAEIGRHEQEGLLPNFFSGDGRPEAYNTVDSSLLYFRAVQELYRVTGDAALIREGFWPVMTRIIRSFMIGTRFAIGMDERGLLHAGDGQNALTWMDATVGGTPVTPRDGYPVEINALWYNALCFARDLAELFAEAGSCFGEAAARTRASFREAFWIPAGSYLGDVVRGGTLDTAVRPNQLFAVSLPFSPLSPPEQAGVVRKVREELLTPCGIRTLAPSDPAYRGRYRGSGPERDAAYHQGTVWPWLLGLYGEASLKVARDRAAEKEALRSHLCTFLRGHLPEAGIGSVSEVFDGDAPHRPGGCIAQAWSVAELIRLFPLLR